MCSMGTEIGARGPMILNRDEFLILWDVSILAGRTYSVLAERKAILGRKSITTFH